MGSLLEDTRLAQIGFIVKDIEKTKKEFARFLVWRSRLPSTAESTK